MLGYGYTLAWIGVFFFMMKAGFFDIDGTLINIMRQQTRITEPTRAAIRKLRAAGCKTFIASGRPKAYLDPELLEKGDFDGYVLMNGALVLYEGRVIYHQPLPKTDVKAITELCEQRGVEYILEGAEHTYLKREFRGFEAFYQSIDVDTDFVVRDYDIDDLEIGKMEFYSTEPLGGGLFTELLQWPGLTGVMDPFHKKNLELYAKDITKGSGILHALEALQIPVAESFAFGDGVNDIEMMQTVGYGIAMGNAQPQVKEIAAATVPSVDDDGVAWGIEHLILKGDA